MDINYLLKREQLSFMMAGRATGVEARHAHLELASGYGKLLVGRRFPHKPFALQQPTTLHAENENPDRGRADTSPANTAVES